MRPFLRVVYFGAGDSAGVAKKRAKVLGRDAGTRLSDEERTAAERRRVAERGIAAGETGQEKDSRRTRRDEEVFECAEGVGRALSRAGQSARRCFRRHVPSATMHLCSYE